MEGAYAQTMRGQRESIAALNGKVAELEATNARLEEQIRTHDRVLSSLSAVMNTLEEKVTHRKAAVASAQPVSPSISIREMEREPRSEFRRIGPPPSTQRLEYKTFVEGYIGNPIDFDKRYRNEFVTVSVKINVIEKTDSRSIPFPNSKEGKIDANKLGDYWIESGFAGKGRLRCIFPSARTDSMANLKAEQTVLVRGRVCGSNSYAVYLYDCALVP